LSPPTALVVLLASAGAAPFHNRNWASRRYWRKKKGILVHSPGHEEGK
jgi:hypothetical protein